MSVTIRFRVGKKIHTEDVATPEGAAVRATFLANDGWPVVDAAGAVIVEPRGDGRARRALVPDLAAYYRDRS